MLFSRGVGTSLGKSHLSRDPEGEWEGWGTCGKGEPGRGHSLGKAERPGEPPFPPCADQVRGGF